MNKRLIIIILIGSINILAQKPPSPTECYNRMVNNYPLLKQKNYIEQIRDYSTGNVWKSYFLQVIISGQVGYRSDVTSLPASIPGIKIESLAREQYKIFADATQKIYDGGVAGAQVGIQKTIALVDDSKIEIELIRLKERINQIYFEILLFEAQFTQPQLIKKEIIPPLEKVNAAFENGTASKSNIDILKAEQYKIEQRIIELNSSRNQLLGMPGLLINQNLDESQKLELPATYYIPERNEIMRPEIILYNYQERLIDQQSILATSKILPKASLFFQGGYGKPAINTLKNDFDWFYIAGAKVTIPTTNFYTYGNEKEINSLNKKSIISQKETFLLNTKISLLQQREEINKIAELIKVDEEIISIRTSIKESAKVELENGVITSGDFFHELSAEGQARQNLIIHSIQLPPAKQNYLLTLGN